MPPWVFYMCTDGSHSIKTPSWWYDFRATMVTFFGFLCQSHFNLVYVCFTIQEMKWKCKTGNTTIQPSKPIPAVVICIIVTSGNSERWRVGYTIMWWLQHRSNASTVYSEFCFGQLPVHCRWVWVLYSYKASTPSWENHFFMEQD